MTPHSDLILSGQMQNAEWCKRLSRLYNRPFHSEWSYGELSEFMGLSRRINFEKELEMVEAFKPKAGRLFPHTLHNLLSRWTEILDRARMNDMKPVIKSTPPPALKGTPIDDETRKRMAEQTRELRKNL